ncbi:unnamed protein product [Zymoseptoria tritici ST99CH_3D1]|nr:unnamed protein product [Zymoseptoria tritici ST99CH_3D1]
MTWRGDETKTRLHGHKSPATSKYIQLVALDIPNLTVLTSQRQGNQKKHIAFETPPSPLPRNHTMPPHRSPSPTFSISTTASDRALANDLFNPFGIFRKPTFVHQRNSPPTLHPFYTTPLLSPLLFDNTDSSARDHLAAERTFLSWLRLAIYMSVVATAILISFHLKHQPSPTERKIALPLGVVFWVLALGCLGAGVGNYVKTVEGYARREAVVQSGWGTQVVFTVVAAAIVAACVLFLSMEVERSS